MLSDMSEQAQLVFSLKESRTKITGDSAIATHTITSNITPELYSYKVYETYKVVSLRKDLNKQFH